MLKQLILLFILFFQNTLETQTNDYIEDALSVTINFSNIVYGEINYYKELYSSSGTVQKINLNFTENSKSSYNNLDNFGYLLIQIQSFAYNLTFARNSTLQTDYYQNGTSLGFIIFDKTKNDNTFYIHNFYEHININYALIIIMYDKESPIPGGCNLDGDTPEFPRLIIKNLNEFILVDTPSASNSKVMDPKQLHCDVAVTNLTYEAKYYYLPKHDFTKETFFKSIKQLLAVNSTSKIGKTAVRESLGSAYRRNYIAVPGTGIIFNTIVSLKLNGSIKKSAYIPTYTYSCDPLFWESGCTIIPDSALMKIISSMLFVVGFIKIFSFVADPFATVFLNSLVIGSYCSFRIMVHFDISDFIRSSSIILTGIVFASILLIISLYCLPLAFVFCILTGGVFSWIFTINTMYLFDSTNETLYICIYCFTLLTVMCLFSKTFRVIWGIINTILGAYSALIGIQLFTKSNMIFIPLNYFYSIKSDKYEYINGFPVADENDTYILIFMMILVLITILYKNKSIKIRTREHNLNETEPLITRWTHGSDDVFESPNTNHRYFNTLSYTDLWS